MAFSESGNEGSFNDTTEVTVVSSPGAGIRRVIRDITVGNRDTVSATIYLRKYKASSIVWELRATLDAGGTWQVEKTMVLDATDEEVKAVLDAAATTTQPTFDAAFADNDTNAAATLTTDSISGLNIWIQEFMQ